MEEGKERERQRGREAGDKEGRGGKERSMD